MANDINRYKKDLPPDVNRHIKLLNDELRQAIERAETAERQMRDMDRELTKAHREIAELKSISKSRGSGTMGTSF